MAKRKVASPKPDGLSVTINGTAITFTWKPKGYASQKMQYNINGSGWVKGWADNRATNNKATKKIVAYYDPNAYYPNGAVLTNIKLRVGGTKADTNKINYTWSGWNEYTQWLGAPPAPSISAAVDTTVQGLCTFTTSTAASSVGYYPYYNGYFQTILVKNCGVNDGYTAFNRSDAIIDSGAWVAGSDYVYTKQEDLLELSSGNSYVRWVRMYSRGAGGASVWSYSYHAYALPNAPVIMGTPEVQASESGGYVCRFAWKVQNTFDRPIDKITPQYCLTTPDDGMVCPDGASWTSLAPVLPTGDSDGTQFTIDRLLAKDQCLFVRANTEHDKIGEDTGVTRGVAKIAAVGYLKDPVDLSLPSIGSDYKVSVRATNKSDVTDSILAIYYTDSDDPEDAIIVGYMPYSTSAQTVTVQCPPFSSSPAIGVRAIVPKETPTYYTDENGVKIYTIEPLMVSEDTLYDGGTIPLCPMDVTAVQTSVVNSVRVSWSWTWADATSAELSWSDHEDAWESTDEPSTYDIPSIKAASWNIAGLDAGVTWYIRVRFKSGSGDNTTYGPYSDMVSITPKSSPAIPSLDLSDSVITPDGSVTAAWGYTTTDGTGQGYAEITTAVINDAGIFYGKYALTEDTEVDEAKTYFEESQGTYSKVTPVGTENPSEEGWYEVVDNIIAHTESAQHVTLYANDPLLNWQAGETHLLCVRVSSLSGAISEGWSAPRSIVIAEPITCAITQNSLDSVDIETLDIEGETVTETVAAITDLPITVTVTGAGTYGTTTLSLERAEPYVVERPDGVNLDGYKGETIAVFEQRGQSQITITKDDLIGKLDDGARYKFVATVQDSLGQTAETSTVTVDGVDYEEFYVLWSHQAITPEANVVIDTDYNVAKITATAPEGATETDKVDIYRLSVDKPELVVEGGSFGTTYVDPYPTIGEYGGHRVVLVTENGDYFNASGEPAWVDTDDILDLDYSIIDFDGNELEVRYNMELSSKFDKDFKVSTYLGGSVKGDWNAAVSRTGSIKAVCEVNNDPDTVEKVRALATYAGVCHIRSKDGSSYAADVQISDDISYASAGKVFKFSATVTRVDPEGLDGMTLSEWEAQL